jgi:inner membrane protein
MIFAHGPLGMLLASAQRRRAHNSPYNLNPKQWVWLLIIGYIGGIFPDIDLFFFYFVNAEQSHREFITHTPILYLGVFLVFGLITWFCKKYKLFLFGTVFIVGTLSHLVTDMVAAKIMLLYPYSHQLFGLQDFQIPMLNGNVLFLNFLMEGIFIFFFFYALIRWNAKRIAWRLVSLVILLAVFVAGLVTIMIGNQHIYHDTSDSHYGDIDGDGTPNYSDRDMDGDTVLNIDDLDADGDGKSNPHEMIENAENFIGVWYDKTEGGFARIPARLGLVTNHDVLWRLFESVGILLGTEMGEDFVSHPENYVNTPASDNFDRDPRNIANWLQHTNRLEMDPAASRDQIGDILFFDHDIVTVVTGFTNEGKALVIDATIDRPVDEITLEQFVQYQGPVRARGIMLDSTPLFQQQ